MIRRVKILPIEFGQFDYSRLQARYGFFFSARSEQKRVIQSTKVRRRTIFRVHPSHPITGAAVCRPPTALRYSTKCPIVFSPHPTVPCSTQKISRNRCEGGISAAPVASLESGRTRSQKVLGTGRTVGATVHHAGTPRGLPSARRNVNNAGGCCGIFEA